MGRIWDRLGGRRLWRSTLRWFDDELATELLARRPSEQIDWFGFLPFFALHLSCFLVIWVGWSPIAVVTSIGLYVVRMLAITGVYHRYFAHRTFKTSRFCQFVGALVASTSGQRGPLWWAAHHRSHHRYADQPEDVHSPIQRGFLWSHVLWILIPKHFPTNKRMVNDWAKYPELVLLNRFSLAPPLGLLALLIAVGELLRVYAPSTGTSGIQMGVWGFCISTVVLFHATATINSLDHLIGRRRYNTPDHSRNNWVLALITFGEGWHNNHHHYPIAARQGFFWWELDLTYYVLVALSWLGIIRGLTPLPPKKRDSNRVVGPRPALATR